MYLRSWVVLRVVLSVAASCDAHFVALFGITALARAGLPECTPAQRIAIGYTDGNGSPAAAASP